MSKITLTNLANLQNETTAVAAVNANNAAITTAMDDTLSRDGAIPNQMNFYLDMNSNRIINLPKAVSAQEPLRLVDLNDFINGTLTFNIPPTNIATTASITAMSHLDTNVITLAILTQAGRAGIFVWDGTNRLTEATNDPGQGIYVPPFGTNGSAGVWTRQYDGPVDFTWWGAIPDGVVTGTFTVPIIGSGTDNTQALTNWNVWASHQSTLGRGTVVEPSPGIYFWDGGYTGPPYGNGYDWLINIKHLEIRGNGTVTFQNIYDQSIHGANFAKSLPWPAMSNGLGGPFGFTNYFINQTVPGTRSFTLTNIADAANLTVGDYVLLGSIDLQQFGSPPNMHNHEYVRVNAVNLGTGVVTIDQEISYQHRTDYPDFTIFGGDPCGKARVWLLNGFNLWDIDHTYSGITVGYPPGGGQAYATLTGRKVNTIDWVGCGFSEAMSETVTHIRPRILTSGETDKLVDSITYYDADMSATGGLGLQSSTPKRMAIYGGRWTSIVGFGRNMVVENADIDLLQSGTVFGITENAVFDSCVIRNLNAGNFTDGTKNITQTIVDGVKVTYANGVIALSKALIGLEVWDWAKIPGQLISLEANPTAWFPNDSGRQGQAIVVSVTEDANFFYITTTLPFAALPAWATGRVYVFTQGPIEFINCTGCETARRFSEACKNGYPYFAMTRFTLGNSTVPLNGAFSNGGGGIVQKIIVDVLQPGAVGAAELVLEFRTSNATTYVSDNPATFVTINIGIPGKRVITATEFSGLVGTDGITVGGAPSAFYPVNRLTWIEGLYALNTAPANLQSSPLVDVTVISDFGLIGKRINSDFFLPIQGLLP